MYSGPGRRLVKVPKDSLQEFVTAPPNQDLSRHFPVASIFTLLGLIVSAYILFKDPFILGFVAGADWLQIF